MANYTAALRQQQNHNGHGQTELSFPIVIFEASRPVVIEGREYLINHNPGAHADYEGSLLPLDCLKNPQMFKDKLCYFQHNDYHKKRPLARVTGAYYEKHLPGMIAFLEPLSDQAQRQLLEYYNNRLEISGVYQLAGFEQFRVTAGLWKFAQKIESVIAVDVVDESSLAYNNGGHFFTRETQRIIEAKKRSKYKK